MYFLRKKKTRFAQISNLALAHYNFADSNQARKFIVATGLLNHIWQNWNQFWRAYWLAHMIGGRDLKNNQIIPLFSNLSEPQALYHLLTLIGKKTRGSTGSVMASYQEATWGDIKIIQDLALALSSTRNSVSNVLNAASLFSLTIEHIQIIRNAQIHISKSNMNKLTSVVPYYLISKPKYPYDIIEAKELSSGKTAINAWVENMNDFLNYL
ncbi:hypothetical protein [Synechocystis sp. PCC 7509]|uniref:hypothetical protein n=1 Tax=Synechocystis sp. PCC 7509 TaxID=927677 RepID=UPI0002ACFE77|nr:hypothetical protein [Synechocystis sp. PCC 7509]